MKAFFTPTEMLFDPHPNAILRSKKYEVQLALTMSPLGIHVLFPLEPYQLHDDEPYVLMALARPVPLITLAQQEGLCMFSWKQRQSAVPWLNAASALLSVLT